MEYNKTSKLIKKFKGLHNTLRDSGQEPSSIEKDLLLSYLKELYEHVMSIGAASAEDTLPIKVAEEVVTASSNGHSQIYEAPAPVTKAVPIVTAPIVEKLESPEQIEVPPISESVPASQPVEVVEPAPPHQSAQSQESNSPLAELFADRGVNELSDRLNKLPISDINRAMGINEKVLTINELFQGDQELFSKTMLKLNSLGSFAEAKDYLVGGVAGDFTWASDSKIKKAEKFIQLLRRRYS